MATGGCELTSDEIPGFKCSACANINKIREAVKYCMECQGYCCQSCTDMHLAFPTLLNHTLLDQSSSSLPRSTSGLPAVPTERCSIHHVKIVDMFCGNHDVVGCTTCMTLEHRTCTDIQSIPEVVDTLLHTSDVHRSYQQIQDKRASMEDITHTRDVLLQLLNKQKTNAENKIKHFRKEMDILLTMIEQQSLNAVDKEFCRKQTTLEEERKNAVDTIDDMKEAAADLKKSEGNIAQQFVCMKMAQKKLAQAEDVSVLLETSPEVQVTYTEDGSIRNFLQRLDTFGVVSFRPLNSKPRTSIYAIKNTRTMNIKIGKDTTTCDVFSSCSTEDGTLLLADSSNNKLKCIDIAKLSVVDYCDLTDSPYGVCCTSKQEGAVSFCTESIQFVSLDKKMTPLRKMNVGHKCYGMAYKDDRLYITDYSKCLYIHNMTGTILQKLSTDSFGNVPFSRSRQIAFSHSGDKMFVSDLENGLISFDGQGTHMNTFRYSELKYTTGVCIDRRGNVFLCGYKSNNVLQIGEDGKKIGVVAKSSDGVKYPRSLYFDPQQCTLYVTQARSNDVMVYELQ